MTQKTTTQIAALLSQAGEAHHEYEQNQLGAYDQNWSIWYAEYIIEQGLGELLNREVNTEQLSQFLSQSSEEYKKSNSEQSWADYTAQKLL